MAHRGHPDGRSTQAPGLMRHGAFSAAGLSGRQSLESSPNSILEILENKLAVLTAEAEKLIRENQRLASSHVVLRQDIVETENEMQMIRTHLVDVQVQTDMHMRELVERIRLMEADILAGEAVKNSRKNITRCIWRQTSYSLRSILDDFELGVSGHILVLDTSIPKSSKMERREYY